MNPTRPPPPANVDALDADITQALTQAQHATPAPPDLVERVRQRVMARVAQDSTARHLTVKAEDDRWRPFGPGVDRKVLHLSEGVMSYLLRLAPGATLPAHRHPIDEECVVLEGTLRIGDDLELRAGGFHLGRKNVAHASITSDLGAIIYLRGAEPVAELLI